MSAKRVLGIDEAGRGAVLGPLVVAGVVLNPQQRGTLKRLGVRDSKEFKKDKGRIARWALAAHVRRVAEVVVVKVFDATRVDEAMEDMKEKGGLDELERTAARSIIKEVKAGSVERVVADGKKLFEPLADCHKNFKAVDQADRDYVAVAAASIVAKSRRDVLFARICQGYRERFGDALCELNFDWDGYVKGGGYSNSNADTEEFLRLLHRELGGELPPETRRRWNWDVVRKLAAPH